MRVRAGFVLTMLLIFMAPAAEARKFRYAEGPQVPRDTTYSVAQVTIDPVVGNRGMRVAATNLQIIGLVANAAVERALRTVPLDSGSHVILAPAESHPLNFMVEHEIGRAHV